MIKGFSKKIKDLRTKSGYSQAQLAAILGVSRTSVANWEAGTRMPSTDTISKASVIFDVTPSYLLGMAPKLSSAELAVCTIDLSKLNSAGIQKLVEYYRYLVMDNKYNSK